MLLIHEGNFLKLHPKSINQYLTWKAQARRTQNFIGTIQFSTELGTMILELKTEIQN